MRQAPGFIGIVLGLSLIFNLAQAETLRVCNSDVNNLQPTLQSAVDNLADHTSGVVAASITAANGFTYLRNWIERQGAKSYCVSAVALSKNAYQYYQFLIEIELADAAGKKTVLPLLFQTASIQAHHNRGPKPWIGLAQTRVNAALTALIADAHFAEIKAEVAPGTAVNPLEIIRAILNSSTTPLRAEVASLSYIPIYNAAVDARYFLVTYLESANSNNPFQNVSITRGYLVRQDASSGRVTVARVDSVFNFEQELEAARTEAYPQTESEDGRTAALTSLSARP
jgi:hypothetical protein